MRNALGFHKFVGFPLQLTVYPVVPKSIPAVNFAENIKEQIGEHLNKAQKIYITPTDFFTTHVQADFQRHTDHIQNIQKREENGSAAHTWVFGHSS